MDEWRDPKKWVTQVASLKAENKRLREALEEIADIPENQRQGGTKTRLHHIAKLALLQLPDVPTEKK